MHNVLVALPKAECVTEVDPLSISLAALSMKLENEGEMMNVVSGSAQKVCLRWKKGWVIRAKTTIYIFFLISQ